MEKIKVLIIEQKTSLMDPQAKSKINSNDIVLIRLKSGYKIEKDNLGITSNKSSDEIDREFKNKEKYVVKSWESKRY